MKLNDPAASVNSPYIEEDEKREGVSGYALGIFLFTASLVWVMAVVGLLY